MTRPLIFFLLIFISKNFVGQTLKKLSFKDTVFISGSKLGVTEYCYNGKHGVIDSLNKTILPADYDNLFSHLKTDEFSYYIVTKNRKRGVINRRFEVIVPIGLYDNIDIFFDGYSRVKKGNKYSFVDSTGKSFTHWFDNAGFFRKGLAKVENKNRWGFIDRQGKIAIPLQYERIVGFCTNGLAAVCNEKKWGFINTNGNQEIPLKYESTGCFWYGYCAVKLNGKWGYIDSLDRVIIPFMYDEALRFDYYGTTCVKKKKKYGFINVMNEVVIPFKFTYASSFDDKYENTMVETSRFGKTFWINRKGECVHGCD